jgi:hypothetical protein
MVIEVASGDNRVKANYLPTTLSGADRSWIINLPKNTIQTWDQLCTIFIGNFQGTYGRPFTMETLKIIKQKHRESLCDYVKHFYNNRNAIPHIQDIKVTNDFRNDATDLNTVEEITMKKPKMVANLLVVANACIKEFVA